ncbi:sulfate ABC transporter permease subunit CysW [Salinisphaera sp. Q1T1-3]|uniref:sulfate ABC transporter permease subunit CysW n=1 Tax=Salinisphaera sp. Q1T1-3 TaxID=2321229 RepID=UPI000E75C4DE|nr:sulfate ABC transporter permease subunit CysW [Salinisphaera sp. Q1T1-3]RJS95394.1 sulfate ABC transporter permease subunit CysW [Salinisphaera sp. Q1T1-3]
MADITANAGRVVPASGNTRVAHRAAADEPIWVRRSLIGLVFVFLGVFLVVPLAIVLSSALSQGWALYARAVTDPDTWSAIVLTLWVVAITVPLNTLFGIAAAWAIARFDFRGRSVLTSLIDLPFSVSPVVVGLAYVLVFGRGGWLGPWLGAHDIQIIFAMPGMVLVTMFVTVPFVARELIPVLAERGQEEEEGALSLGASGWQTFFRVTLPAVKWGLLYGVVLTTARALGEYGAVAVVSGRVPGENETLTLRVDMLYENYQATAAFAVASLLAVIALITLVLKTYLGDRKDNACPLSAGAPDS